MGHMPQSFKRPFRPNRPKVRLSQRPKHGETKIPIAPNAPRPIGPIEPHLCIGYAPVP